MLNKFVAPMVGLVILVLPLAVSAQTVIASSSTSANSSLIALLTQLVEVLEQELQLLLVQHGTPTTVPAPQPSVHLSATPSSGPAPLAVSLVGTGATGGQQYIIDYGDGGNSGPLAAIDVCMHLSDGSGGCPKVQASHTYTYRGTFTAMLEGYISCMWSNPRCMIATIPLATVTVTVQ